MISFSSYCAALIYIFTLMGVTYRSPYAMRHIDARGWGAVTNDVLKFRKVIEFESSCIVISLSYIYLIIDGKRSFIN